MSKSDSKIGIDNKKIEILPANSILFPIDLQSKSSAIDTLYSVKYPIPMIFNRIAYILDGILALFTRSLKVTSTFCIEEIAIKIIIIPVVSITNGANVEFEFFNTLLIITPIIPIANTLIISINKLTTNSLKNQTIPLLYL